MKFQSGTCSLGYKDDPPASTPINANWKLGYPQGSGGTNTEGQRSYQVRVFYPDINAFAQAPTVSAVISGIEAAPGDSGKLQVELLANPGSPLGDNPREVFTLEVRTDGDCKIYELDVSWFAFTP